MKHVYHGTTKQKLEIIKPFKRYTPGGEDIAGRIPPRIYATYNPAYAAAHSFPWSSEDGFDIKVEGSNIALVVPRGKAQILEQPICIYTVPDDSFTFTLEEETGLTCHSEFEITPIDCQCFLNVTEALKHYGGAIQII